MDPPQQFGALSAAPPSERGYAREDIDLDDLPLSGWHARLRYRSSLSSRFGCVRRARHAFPSKRYRQRLSITCSSAGRPSAASSTTAGSASPTTPPNASSAASPSEERTGSSPDRIAVERGPNATYAFIAAGSQRPRRFIVRPPHRDGLHGGTSGDQVRQVRPTKLCRVLAC